ncbi:MAG: putative small protein [Schlesneria sp.]|nr:putative small protein [Schlesneria sp.]
MVAFKKAGIVWLKNGGPDLLVSAIDGEIVTCIWFSKSLLKKATYESVLLTKTSLAKAATEEIDKLMNEWCQASSSLPPE